MRAATAWLMWSMPAALFLIAFFHRNAPGVMARDIMETFGVTGAVIGLVSATYFYSYAGFMVPAGILLEAFGARRVVAAGGAVMALGTLAMGVAGGTAMLFAGRFAVGLGATVTFIGTLKVAATWFPPERFGFLSAVSATVGVVGALVAAAPLALLMALAGWRGALVIIGAVTLACSLVCLAVLRDRPAAAAADPPPRWGAVLRGMRMILGNAHTWPIFLAFFCLYSALGNLFLWAVPFLRDVYGLGTTAAATVAAATSIALLGAAPLTGFVSDTVLQRRKTPFVALTVALLAVWAIFLGTLGVVPLWAVAAIFFGMGVFGGAFVLTWPIGREVNPPELAGLAVAVVNLGGFLGAALTQGPVGAVLDARWAGAVTAGGARAYPVEAYRAAFAVCTAFVLAAALLSLLLRETQGRNVWREAA
ncbi:MAG TPA: MFS transporter [Methylomirabilota bacterium]|jgi:sugar phosphate permease|nr:MFS transporter [Methylomirabilota bacterium]